jgi:hypothetical protein
MLSKNILTSYKNSKEEKVNTENNVLSNETCGQGVTDEVWLV